MKDYEVTFSCGHKEMTPINDEYGEDFVKYWIHDLETKGLCKKCEHKHINERTLALGLPKLEGPEEQIEQAQKDRLYSLDTLHKKKEVMKAHIRNVQKGNVLSKDGKYPAWVRELSVRGATEAQMITRIEYIISFMEKLEGWIRKETLASNIIKNKKKLSVADIIFYADIGTVYGEICKRTNKKICVEDLWKEAQEEALKLGLVPLDGTERQMGWANQIRVGILNDIQAIREELKAHIEEVQENGVFVVDANYFSPKGKRLEWICDIDAKRLSAIQVVARLRLIVDYLNKTERSIRRRTHSKYFIENRTKDMSLSSLWKYTNEKVKFEKWFSLY